MELIITIKKIFYGWIFFSCESNLLENYGKIRRYIIQLTTVNFLLDKEIILILR